MKTSLARLANRLYDHAPALHRTMYGVYKSWSDRAERRFLAQLIEPGMTVLDVGANIGVYTTFLARLVGPSGRVIAFEPEERNVQRLRAATQRYKQVEVVHAAVSDRSGVLNLYVADDLNVDHRSYAPVEKRPSIEVRCLALDDFVAQRYPVHVIKMDIQGAELAALRGARQLLAKNPAPLLLLEYWPYGLRSAGSDPADLIAGLESAGFQLSTLGDAPFPSVDATQADEYVNVVARRRNNVD